jgi:hypothetical protein
MSEVYTVKVYVQRREEADKALLDKGEQWFGHRSLTIASKTISEVPSKGDVVQYEVTARLTSYL